MIAEVPAAPEAPVLLLWALAVMALFGYLLARGLLAAWKHTIGALLEGLADHLHIHVWRVHWDIGGWLRSADHKVVELLGWWAQSMDAAAGRMFHTAALVQRWVAHEIWAATGSLLHFGNWLVYRRLPHFWQQVIKWGLPGYAIYRAIRAAINQNWPKILHAIEAHLHFGSKSITNEIALPYRWQWDWLHRHWKELTALLAGIGAVAVPGALPWVHVFPRVKILERFDIFSRRRLARLEKLLGAAGIAAVMANALGLPNWRCITRGNVGRTSRFLCGMPAHLLEDFLALAADFFVLTNICDVIRLLEPAFNEVAAPVISTLAKAGSAVCSGGLENAKPLDVRQVYVVQSGDGLPHLG